MLGEFFAAREQDIDETLVEEGPFERFETIEAKTVDHVSISMLGTILGVGRFDQLFKQVDSGPYSKTREAGIASVPVAMRDALVEANDLDSIAAQWAATEELADWDPEDVRQVVRDLGRLAQQARSDDRHLWFWWSL